MKQVLLKNVQIIDKRSPWHGKSCDIRIEEGQISDIQLKVPPKPEDHIIELPKLHISPLWVDIHCYCGEPGYEERETFETLAQAAVAGGFGHLLVMPDNDPMPDQEASIEYIFKSTENLPVYIHVAACLTQQSQGKIMSEMLSLSDAGAAAFSDGLSVVDDSRRLTNILLYANQTGKTVFHRPGHTFLESEIWAAESVLAVSRGIQGIPAHAESLGIIRDLIIARYTGVGFHSIPVSSTHAIEMFKSFRETSDNFTLGTFAPYLYLTENAISYFDPNAIIWPPLKPEEDVQALRKACKEGIIFAIASGHTPLNQEIKVHEPDLAKPGMITLESAFGMIWTALKSEMDISDVISLISLNPASLLNISLPVLDVGQKAEFTLFNPQECWTFTEKDIRSKSNNTPILGHKLVGKPYGIFAKGRLKLNENFL